MTLLPSLSALRNCSRIITIPQRCLTYRGNYLLERNCSRIITIPQRCLTYRGNYLLERNCSRIITIPHRCLTYRAQTLQNQHVLPVTMVKTVSQRVTNQEIKKYKFPEENYCKILTINSLSPVNTVYNEYQCPTKSRTVEILDIINNSQILDCPNTSTVNSTGIILPTMQFFHDLNIQRDCPGIESPEKLAKRNIRKIYSIKRIRQRKINRHKLKKFRKREVFMLRRLKANKLKKKEQKTLAEIKDIYRKVDEYDPLGVIKEDLALARRGGYRIDLFGDMPNSK